MYTVAAGDTLWSIAQRAYGDGSAWKLIARENRITDANVIFVGTTLRIPRQTLAPSSLRLPPSHPQPAARGMPVMQPPMMMPKACHIAVDTVTYSCESELFRCVYPIPSGVIVTLTVKGSLDMQLLKASSGPATAQLATGNVEASLKAEYDAVLTKIAAETRIRTSKGGSLEVSTPLSMSANAQSGESTIECTLSIEGNGIVYRSKATTFVGVYRREGGGSPAAYHGTLEFEARCETGLRSSPVPIVQQAPVYAATPTPLLQNGVPPSTRTPNTGLSNPPLIPDWQAITDVDKYVVLGVAVAVVVVLSAPAVIALLAKAGLAMTAVAGAAAVMLIVTTPIVGVDLVPATQARNHTPRGI
jgi:hypothetical protein